MSTSRMTITIARMSFDCEVKPGELLAAVDGAGEDCGEYADVERAWVVDEPMLVWDGDTINGRGCVCAADGWVCTWALAWGRTTMVLSSLGGDAEGEDEALLFGGGLVVVDADEFAFRFGGKG